MSLTLFKDEILVLLGHNGAGKTTTISMVTGSEVASSGSATLNIDGKKIDLFKEVIGDENLIGVCPQETILLERMSVRENLYFFAKFKNIPNPEKETEKILKDFNLIDRANANVKEISGG